MELAKVAASEKVVEVIGVNITKSDQGCQFKCCVGPTRRATACVAAMAGHVLDEGDVTGVRER